MKFYFSSLGCDKNLVDAERMIGSLLDARFELTDDAGEAEVIVVNTCCFIDEAKEESIGEILRLAEYRKSGKARALVVSGCLAERYREEIFREIPETDAVLGTRSFHRIAEVVNEALNEKRPAVFDPQDAPLHEDGRRVLSTGGHYAFLKIAEGCDKHCTYCVIPSVRGPFRSVPVDQLVAEAKSLAGAGVKELILVAQEVTRYGLDLYGEKRLHCLLSELCKIRELAWIRVLYCYPEEIYPELLACMADEEKICKYLDLPIQHASDRILKKMGRKTNRAELTGIIEGIRERVPGITLRTTLIAGFPGETEEDHRELVGFVKEMRFDRLGVFAYSQEEGTPAAAYPDQVDADIKERRREELLLAQQEVSAKRGESLLGRETEVIIEGLLADEDILVGRTRADAPEVDGLIFFEKRNREYLSGEIVRARITGHTEYDVTGEIIE